MDSDLEIIEWQKSGFEGTFLTWHLGTKATGWNVMKTTEH